MSLKLEGVELPLSQYNLKVGFVLNGRVTGLFGPSGSGKTSLLEIVAGLRRPMRGAVTLNGSEITNTETGKFVATEHRAIGYLPQDGALFPHLSVEKNLRYGTHHNREVPAGLTEAHVVEVLEIGALLGRRVGTLSGGEKQRVALGRALLAGPRLLLLDEPLAGMDEALKSRVIPYLVRVRDEFKIPMVYVTHSPAEVMALCDEVVVLERGMVRKHGKPVDIFVSSATPAYELRGD